MTGWPKLKARSSEVPGGISKPSKSKNTKQFKNKKTSLLSTTVLPFWMTNLTDGTKSEAKKKINFDL